MKVDTETLVSYENYLSLRKIGDTYKSVFPNTPLVKLASELALSENISKLVVKAFYDNDFTLYPVEKCIFDVLTDNRNSVEILNDFLDALE